MSDNFFDEEQYEPYEEEQTEKYLTWAVVGLGFFIYAALGILFAGHNYNLISYGVSDDLLWTAYAGVGGLIGSYLLFPVGTHFWAVEKWHRRAIITFNVVDILILIGNTVASYNLNTAVKQGLEAPAFIIRYIEFFAPAAPIAVAVMWLVLFAMWPRSREIVEMRKAKSNIQLTVLQQMNRFVGSKQFYDDLTKIGYERARKVVGQVVPEFAREERQVVQTTAPVESRPNYIVKKGADGKKYLVELEPVGEIGDIIEEEPGVGIEDIQEEEEGTEGK